jgi:hypothetical protein
MIRKPAFLSDTQMIAILREDYGFEVLKLQFLPFGEASWCYLTNGF